jgi:hypothetical protein
MPIHRRVEIPQVLARTRPWIPWMGDWFAMPHHLFHAPREEGSAPAEEACWISFQPKLKWLGPCHIFMHQNAKLLRRINFN